MPSEFLKHMFSSFMARKYGIWPFWALIAFVGVQLIAGCALVRTEKKFDPAVNAFGDDSMTFTRHYDHLPEVSCEAARRALLSQGYIVEDHKPRELTARKNFQSTREDHYEIDFNVTCVLDQERFSTVFVNAVQQLYALKKTNTNASLGVSVLGSLSMPISSVDDSLIKVGSVTLTKTSLYKRFFDLLEDYLDPIGRGYKAIENKSGDDLSPNETEMLESKPAALQDNEKTSGTEQFSQRMHMSAQPREEEKRAEDPERSAEFPQPQSAP